MSNRSFLSAIENADEKQRELKSNDRLHVRREVMEANLSSLKNGTVRRIVLDDERVEKIDSDNEVRLRIFSTHVPEKILAFGNDPIRINGVIIDKNTTISQDIIEKINANAKHIGRIVITKMDDCPLKINGNSNCMTISGTTDGFPAQLKRQATALLTASRSLDNHETARRFFVPMRALQIKWLQTH